MPYPLDPVLPYLASTTPSASLFVAGWRFRMDGGTISLCVWVLGAVRVYYRGVREGSTFIAQGRVFAR